MVHDAPKVLESYALEDSEARQLWNWLLGRHGLSEDTKFDSVLGIAQATLGLHAARLPSPFTTVIARSLSPTVALTLFEKKTHADLITVRCMRKTLHALPLELAVVAHRATQHFRERDALRAISNANVSVRHILGTVDAIVDLLGREGLMAHRAIEARVMTPRTSVAEVRLALKLAWERGVLTYRNDTTRWNRENRRFGLTARLYPDLDTSMDRHKATGELIREYFDRYGPASLRDVAWWSGLSRLAITTAMNESTRHFVAIHAPWCQSLLYMYGDQYDRFRDTRDKFPQLRSPELNFLAHEDVALKAYFESRSRYLGNLPPRRAFNQIGEVLPTIVYGGQVVGTWAWDPRKMAVTYSIIHGYGSPGLRKEAIFRANALSETLRLRWAQT
ncbi:MAG: DNA glycosylase AlkZ-like family protein [Pseudonocardiaceae bacterium]